MLLEEGLDQVKVEDFLEHLEVILGRVNNLYLERTICLGANALEVDLWNVCDLVGCDALGELVHLVGETLWGWRAIGKVVFDTKVLGWSCMVLESEKSRVTVAKAYLLTTRVVACSEQDTTGCLSDTDQVTGGRCAHDAILTDEELLDTVCSTNLCDQLSDLWVVVATISTNDEESSIRTLWNRLDDRGNEVLRVVLLLEDLDLLAQTGAGRKSVRHWFVVGSFNWYGFGVEVYYLRSRLLVGVWLGVNSLDTHDCGCD